jgi:mRNA-degrading endonuclease RelE of RelBE toxin-antitoxin system
MPEIQYESERVRRELSGLDRQEKERILEAIESKLQNLTWRTKGIRRLQGKNRSRLRVGDYRVIFSRDKNIIVVHAISKRDQAY